ncbi:MAG: DUF4832 domain-containing protein [Pirellulaceae bacterium]
MPYRPWMLVISFLLLVSGLLPRNSSLAQDATTVVVEPRDNGQALVNPDMGWTMHFYSNVITNYGSKLPASDTLQDFPGLSTVYLRLPWSFLEPAEGSFDWSVVDTPAQRWISEGKRVAFRISCCESWMRYATPQWVEQAGAKGNNFTVGKGLDENGPFWEPVYDDPIFLEKLEKFLAVFSKRYDGNPHVAFVDVGSFGVWGEGHCWASTKLEIEDAIKQRHIDLYLKYFPHTLLAVSDDFIGPGNKVAHHPLTDYMLSKGVTLRDDSICVQPPPNSWFHAELAQSFWRQLPVVLEHEHYGASVDRNAWGDGSLLLQSIEEYHASYMSIHWWPREFLDQNRDVIDRINRRLGYRLQLRKLSWPRQVTAGQPFNVAAAWANAGVAPCYPGGYMTMTLKDSQGGIGSVHVLEQLDMRDLPVGAPEQALPREINTTCTLARRYADGPRSFARAAEPGTYDVYVSVGTLDGTPRIALPLDQEDGQRRYRVGTLEVVSP